MEQLRPLRSFLVRPHANSSQFTLTQREGLPTWHKEDRQPACSGEVKGFRLGTRNKSEGACQNSG